MYSRTLAVLLTSLIFGSGCAINRADSLRMLDQRAEYDQENSSALPPALREAGVEGFKQSPVPVRSRPKVAAIWIHPHETATHDYFWGGWLSVVVEQDQWILSKPGQLPKAPGVIDPSKVPQPSAKKEKAGNT